MILRKSTQNQRNPLFTGHEEVLMYLRSTLRREKGSAARVHYAFCAGALGKHKRFWNISIALEANIRHPKVLLTEASYAALLRKMGLEEEAAQLEEHKP